MPPVRKIPKNYLLVTGAYSSKKNALIDAFESLLEKEHMMLLDFDESVAKFEPQPVRIPVPGVAKGYVPDLLVTYRPDPQTGMTRMPSLVEVKKADDLARNAEKYAPKFAAARQYAQDRGWEFQIITEVEIRIPRLANLKFLREYRNNPASSDDIQTVLTHMANANGETSSLALLDALAPTTEDKLYWLPVIWSMLLKRTLLTNMEMAFSNDVPLWLPVLCA